MLLAAGAIFPAGALAQSPALPLVGWIRSGSAQESAHLVEAFRQGLGEHGFAEGRNVAVEYRWGDGRYDRLAELAAELVQRKVAVIAASGGLITARAAQAATKTTPIVFVGGDDPVRLGLVASLNRPGGNTTGISLFTAALGAKKLELLAELVPPAAEIAVLVNPRNPSAEFERTNTESAARAAGRRIHIVSAGNERALEDVFAELEKRRPGAVLVTADTFFLTHRIRVAALAAKSAVPAIYAQREFVDAGGLMSYGSSLKDIYRQLGVYTGRILKGEKPGELPVAQPVKFELLINLKTAKALGLRIPDSLLVRADEVIE
jgi:putative tryptophan/tyrosine transport system substrate-binding protein